jgi:hypothetical protein
MITARLKELGFDLTFNVLPRNGEIITVRGIQMKVIHVAHVFEDDNSKPPRIEISTELVGSSG